MSFWRNPFTHTSSEDVNTDQSNSNRSRNDFLDFPADSRRRPNANVANSSLTSPRTIPSKRGHGSLSNSNAASSPAWHAADSPLDERSSKRGKASNDPSENGIPCICHMTGMTDYTKCTKRHKYLSHLARHLHSHDVYICQMCFMRFDGHGKDENLRNKQAHHCIKSCNNGNCQRHQLQAEPRPPQISCTHLFTWQERWNELFRAVYPGLPLPSLPETARLEPRSPTIHRRNASIALTGSFEDSSGWSANNGVPEYTTTQFIHRELPDRTRHDFSHSYETFITQSTGMARTASSVASEEVSTRMTSPPPSFPNPSLAAIHGNQSHTAYSLPGDDSILDNTGLGAMDTDSHMSYVGDTATSDQQDIVKNQLMQGDSIINLLHRVDQLEQQGKDRQQRIESLEAALRRSLNREEELNSQLTAARRGSGET
ncbi:hypothetical protein HII31_07032 [Pseudocercospora fuligena]|uniref:Uncharacterized protein n=1 Tax=Pseudocercospora fuligena TaxID=685502 RepID=A0A8H6VHB4_9PEZI|nr:hypothetical protein HII31_07032 [Pseudocercospora fuligena]